MQLLQIRQCIFLLTVEQKYRNTHFSWNIPPSAINFRFLLAEGALF